MVLLVATVDRAMQFVLNEAAQELCKSMTVAGNGYWLTYPCNVLLPQASRDAPHPAVGADTL